MAKAKLHGRAFYQSLGSPKYIVAPMVDQSEFAWRLLTRSFLPPDLRSSILAYSPMLHAKLFADGPKYRQHHFEAVKPPQIVGDGTYEEADAYLDGNAKMDRPLFVQFCANDPKCFLEAAKMVQPYCDAVDLNLGCPQGIARRGSYGSFLQEDWDTIYKLVNTLHQELDIPVTAKMRILETNEKTLDYAKMILKAGASIITVHGRQRDQKGHNTGLADWSVIRFLREQLPPDTVIFANGNILQHDDIEICLRETGADGVMSAEGNLYDPSIFAEPPALGQEGREYWRGRDGKGGYRADAVLRRYLDIIHEHVLGRTPPMREPLFLPSDLPPAHRTAVDTTESCEDEEGGRPTKKQKREDKKIAKAQTRSIGQEKCTNPNLVAMQAHCFHILRSLVSQHHDVRNALASCRAGDIEAFENVLALTEAAVRQGMSAYQTSGIEPLPVNPTKDDGKLGTILDPATSSEDAVRRCTRPYWICQPYVRPSPQEALEKGSMKLSKKQMRKLAEAEQESAIGVDTVAKESGVNPEGRTEKATDEAGMTKNTDVEIPREGLVCG